MIASFVGEHVVAPKKALQGITVVVAAAISAVAAVEDAALKGFAAMCFCPCGVCERLDCNDC